MRIAVYPGSFDPLHIGHLAIMEYLSNSPDFDLVYLIVSPQNPFKSAEKSLNAEERLKAAKEAVARHSGLNVMVDDIEMYMSPPHYTIRTLDALREREPENEFTLVIGADNLKDILKWKEGRRIIEEYGLAVYPRNGYDYEELRREVLAEIERTSGNGASCAGIRLMDAPIKDISSTELREKQDHGQEISPLLM